MRSLRIVSPSALSDWKTGEARVQTLSVQKLAAQGIQQVVRWKHTQSSSASVELEIQELSINFAQMGLLWKFCNLRCWGWIAFYFQELEIVRNCSSTVRASPSIWIFSHRNTTETSSEENYKISQPEKKSSLGFNGKKLELYFTSHPINIFV